MKSTGIILEAMGVAAGYGDLTVLFDIGLTVRMGEWVLLIGPNGSGKSTFLKAAGGLIPLKKGEIHIDIPGIKLTQRVKEHPAGHVLGFLKQTGNIFPMLTVRENLEMASFYSRDSEAEAYLDLLFSIFPDLKEILPQRAGLLSGGMRQKLAIGMVLAKRYPLLLLDEPTAGLAPHAAVDILDKIEILRRELSKTEPITIVMVEHNYRYIKDKVTRLVGMREGKIVIDSVSPMEILEDKALMEKIFFG